MDNAAGPSEPRDTVGHRPRRRGRGYAYKVFYRLPPRIRRLLARCVAPTYLVGAVVVILDSEAACIGAVDRLLLLRQPPGHGWGLPAGLLKKNERAVEGAVRELFEETGVRVASSDLLAGCPNAIIHPAGGVDTVWFGSVPASTTSLRVDGGEVLEARWFAVDNLPVLTPGSADLLAGYGFGSIAGLRWDPSLAHEDHGVRS
ncbi:NUDIX domain-containing protein [Actinoplanes sp. NPDC051343]|uniref:NUDIX domain-containing protein n=1 Tax=Actinoplanes sp. NPDC051343 TaxID=3363906 RepID=UPI00379FC7E8